MNQQTELKAADTLLERGVRVKIRAPLLLRIFRKKTISLVIKQPTWGTMLRVSRLYLKMGISSEELKGISVEKAIELMSKNGKGFSKIIACLLLNGYITYFLFNRPLAFFLRESMEPNRMAALVELIILFGGVEDFMNTIRSVSTTIVTAPNLSPENQGS
ncbi:MAG: hypothetical protein ACO1NU_08725 [Arcticibacter sp.]